MGMRTTLDIPDELMAEAQQESRLATKRDVVIAGLHELIKKAHREDLRALAGRVHLDLDLGRSRKRRP